MSSVSNTNTSSFPSFFEINRHWKEVRPQDSRLVRYGTLLALKITMRSHAPLVISPRAIQQLEFSTAKRFISYPALFLGNSLAVGNLPAGYLASALGNPRRLYQGGVSSILYGIFKDTVVLRGTFWASARAKERLGLPAAFTKESSFAQRFSSAVVHGTCGTLAEVLFVPFCMLNSNVRTGGSQNLFAAARNVGLRAMANPHTNGTFIKLKAATPQNLILFGVPEYFCRESDSTLRKIGIGAAAGALASFVTYPFELERMRRAYNPAIARMSLGDMARKSIDEFKTHGLRRALDVTHRGILPPLLVIAATGVFISYFKVTGNRPAEKQA